MDMRKHVAEQAGLAATYAEDGAYSSAARVLRTLTSEVEAHARAVDAQLNGNRYAEEDCPGHVASRDDHRVCGRCGVHIDALRPDDPHDPINLAGSGPVPIVQREG